MWASAPTIKQASAYEFAEDFSMIRCILPGKFEF